MKRLKAFKMFLKETYEVLKGSAYAAEPLPNSLTAETEQSYCTPVARAPSVMFVVAPSVFDLIISAEDMHSM